MKLNLYWTLLLAICITQATPSSARADLGHNHADHDRAFLAWAASLKASEGASTPATKSTGDWMEGTVISIDPQKKLIQIQGATTPKSAPEKSEFSIGNPNQFKSIAAGSRVRFKTKLNGQETFISEIEATENKNRAKEYASTQNTRRDTRNQCLACGINTGEG